MTALIPILELHAAIRRAELTGNATWRDASAQPWHALKELFGLNDFDPPAGMVEKIERARLAWMEEYLKKHGHPPSRNE